jgi:uncharacterized membrane protein
MDDLKILATLVLAGIAAPYGWMAIYQAFKTGKVSPYSMRHPYDREPVIPYSLAD